jgi:hypothetical protein
VVLVFALFAAFVSHYVPPLALQVIFPLSGTGVIMMLPEV